MDNVSNHPQAALRLLHLNAIGHEVLRRDPARPLPAPKDAELQLERPHVVPRQLLPTQLDAQVCAGAQGEGEGEGEGEG